MRILFLDIDGVLNNHQTLKNRPQLDPYCVGVLNAICYVTHCKIVISSTWRAFHTIEEIQRMLLESGFEYPTDIIDKTPDICDIRTESGLEIATSVPRGREIQKWLDEFGQHVTSFVIVDDDSDMEHLLPHLVKTSMLTGLTTDHAKKIVDHLVPTS